MSGRVVRVRSCFLPTSFYVLAVSETVAEGLRGRQRAALSLGVTPAQIEYSGFRAAIIAQDLTKVVCWGCLAILRFPRPEGWPSG